jgi:hypothetical protein
MALRWRRKSSWLDGCMSELEIILGKYFFKCVMEFRIFLSTPDSWAFCK